MDVRVGVAGLRPELAVHALATVIAAGAEVVPIDVAGAAGSLGSSGFPGLVLADGGAGQWAPAPGVSGGSLVLVHLPGEAARARHRAVAFGARAVVELPTASAWLTAQVRPAQGRGVLAVIGVVGGSGATTAAIACAAAADDDCLLVDADPASTGLDLPLGLPDSGARWSAIPDGTQPLVAESLRAALPRIGGMTVLTGEPIEASDEKLGRVLDVGRAHFGRAVVDLGRHLPADSHPGPDWLLPADRVVVMATATVAGVVGCRRALAGAPPGQVLVAIRPTPWLGVDDVARELALDHVVEVPHLRRIPEAAECGDLLGGRAGRDLRRLGERLWAAVP